MTAGLLGEHFGIQIEEMCKRKENELLSSNQILPQQSRRNPSADSILSYFHQELIVNLTLSLKCILFMLRQ